MSRELVFGAQYYRPPNPPRADWPRDLRLMREIGFDTVKLWACWSWIDGSRDRSDFDDLDELMQIAHSVGLRVVINTILENAPYWLARRHPEARYHDHEDRPVHLTAAMNTPGGGWPGLCFHNEGARDVAGGFLETLVRRYRAHPALFCWDVWNEPHLEPASYFPERIYCYCDASRAAFRTWLQQRYGAIERLNSSWARRFSGFDEVEPPRLFEAVPDMLDWRRFWFETIQSWLSWRVERVRCVDAAHDVMTHVALSGHLGQLATHTLDEFGLAESVDLFGTSSFPTWLMANDPVEHLFNLETARDAADGKPFWQAELQGGRGRRAGAASTPHPTPAQIQSWIWNAIASGARGVVFWQWRPELLGPESPGYGLCTPSGELTERATAAGALARELRASELLADTTPAQAPIAVLLSRDTALLTYATDRTLDVYAAAVAGAHRLLTDAGVPLRFLHAETIASAGVPDGVKAIWWPMPLVASAALSAALDEFVRAGGNLIAEASPGQHDEHGWCVPGAGYLRELFGAEVAESDIAASPYVTIANGSRIRGAWQVDTLVAREAAAAGVDDSGALAATRNARGAGHAALIGTFASLDYSTHRDAQTRDAMVNMLCDGLELPIWAWKRHRPGLVARMLERPQAPGVLVAVNHTLETAAITVRGTSHTVEPFCGRLIALGE
jgi:beta-galactosidase GanA